MKMGTVGTKRYIQLNSSNDLPDNIKSLHLLGTLNQHVVFKADAVITSERNVQKIVPTEGLPSGILTITVFDSKWNALAERITFINNHDYTFQTSMEVQHWCLNKRARNEILIT